MRFLLLGLALVFSTSAQSDTRDCQDAIQGRLLTGLHKLNKQQLETIRIDLETELFRIEASVFNMSRFSAFDLLHDEFLRLQIESQEDFDRHRERMLTRAQRWFGGNTAINLYTRLALIDNSIRELKSNLEKLYARYTTQPSGLRIDIRRAFGLGPTFENNFDEITLMRELISRLSVLEKLHEIQFAALLAGISSQQELVPENPSVTSSFQPDVDPALAFWYWHVFFYTRGNTPDDMMGLAIEHKQKLIQVLGYLYGAQEL